MSSLKCENLVAFTKLSFKQFLELIHLKKFDKPFFHKICISGDLPLDIAWLGNIYFKKL
jgi:hypothetical protein